jgi:acyl-CoA thioesterase
MSATGPPQGANGAPAGGSAAREPDGPSRGRTPERGARSSSNPPQAWGDHTSTPIPASTHEPDAQALAERVGAAMYASDQASRALGMHIEHIGPGHAAMTMTVRDDMLNGHAICHGGYIFLLADSTFAFACNSYNRNTVAQGCSIDYLAPVRAGDVLHATGIERSRTGRTGVYDIEVRNQDGATVALFRGKSYRIDGRVVDES